MHGVRRVAQRRGLDCPAPGFNFGDLVPDRDHRLDEAINLGLGFGLGRLDHQRPRHREAHSRGMEAVIDQPLGDVVDGDAATGLQRARVDDAFMRDTAADAAIEHREVRLQPIGDVIGVEDRDFGRPRQPFAAHHQDVEIRDGEDRR